MAGPNSTDDGVIGRMTKYLGASVVLYILLDSLALQIMINSEINQKYDNIIKLLCLDE